MEPDVLHLILCDEVQADPNNFHLCNVFGLMNSIRSAAAPPLPVVRPQLLALVIWTGGRFSHCPPVVVPQNLRNRVMNPDPTITVSWDYLVELSDDGMQPDKPESEVIIMPPASQGPDLVPAPGIAAEQEQQL